MWQENIDLKNKTSFHIGAKARHFAQCDSEELLLALLASIPPTAKPYIFGSLTNVLLPDSDLDWVIQMMPSKKLPQPQNNQVIVWAGERMGAFCQHILQQGLDLAQFTSLPGSIGGAVWNNSHYSSNFFADHIVWVRFFDPEKKAFLTLKKSELNFAYDKSYFQTQKVVITQVALKLTPIDPQLGAKKSHLASKRRQATQPLTAYSAGCFWQNVPNNLKLKRLFPQFRKQKYLSSGFLLDQAGLKGKRVGGAMVSEKHAAFIINLGHATQSEVLQLAHILQKEIQNKFGVTLKPEVAIITNS